MSFELCPRDNFNSDAVGSEVSAKIYNLLVEQERKTGQTTTSEDFELLLSEAVKGRKIAFDQQLFSSRLETIPLRYRNLTFDDYRCSGEKDRLIVEHMKTGQSAILYGANGTGKTMLAFCAIRRQWEAGKYAQYILAADFFDLIKNSFNGGDPLKVLKTFTAFDYLVIDEIDKKHGTQTEYVYLYRLINDRYNEMKATVLISNSNRKDLENVVGISAFSRVAGDGKIIEFDGEDFRKRR